MSGIDGQQGRRRSSPDCHGAVAGSLQSNPTLPRVKAVSIEPTRFKNIRIVKAPSPRAIRTAWVSDLHLGTRSSNAAAFLDFLRHHEIQTLYIVGDLIDVWQLRRGIYWPQEHNDVIQKLLRAARKGTRVIYIPGNHDEFVTRFCGVYGHISIQKHAIHLTADG
ncbi:MAG: UDP-2,3-diacylglucosamine diphosphatase, partial [Chthoniobacterales bacterium]